MARGYRIRQRAFTELGRNAGRLAGFIIGQSRSDTLITMTMPRTVPSDRCLTILLVDDDPLVREVTAWMLEDAGHDVTEAEDGVAALDHLTSHGPVDLLITDVNMPGMDGRELLREVRRRWPSLPVLVVSGRQSPDPAAEFMPKPFRLESLIAAVDRVSHPAV
jgi:CheY-like chemotaxis protein